MPENVIEEANTPNELLTELPVCVAQSTNEENNPKHLDDEEDLAAWHKNAKPVSPTLIKWLASTKVPEQADEQVPLPDNLDQIPSLSLSEPTTPRSPNAPLSPWWPRPRERSYSDTFGTNNFQTECGLTFPPVDNSLLHSFQSCSSKRLIELCTEIPLATLHLNGSDTTTSIREDTQTPTIPSTKVSMP